MRSRIAFLSAAAILVAALTPAPAAATTWGQTEVDDPIVKGARCTVGSPASYGSYIYNWPSKYDLVFWPVTEKNGVWFCAQSGFTAFIGDFDGIDEAQRAAIAAYLATAYTRGEATPRTKELELLEGCYALRNLPVEDNVRMLRALAYQYEGLGDQHAADERRRKVLALILAALETDLKESRRLEYLFVAAAYQREFGQTDASDATLGRLRTQLDKTSDKELADYVEYLRELSADIPRIEPGGRLAPEQP